MMKLIILVFIFFCIISSTGCRSKNVIQKPVDVNSSQTKAPDIHNIVPVFEDEISPLDSLRNLKVDTSTLKGKREYIWNQYNLNNSPPTSDTLFDLNYDGHKDYVIKYYGLAGNGIKFRMQVYLYNKRFRTYIADSILSDFVNPSFYLDQKKITEFYIAGSGSGRRWEWINEKWIITKEFDVEGYGAPGNVVWRIYYPLKKRKMEIVRPFEMIPPPEILETNIDF